MPKFIIEVELPSDTVEIDGEVIPAKDYLRGLVSSNLQYDGVVDKPSVVIR